MRDEESRHAAEQREQMLSVNSCEKRRAAAHPQRESQRDLAPPPKRAREKQVRHVGAGDQQHDERHAADPRRDLGDRSTRWARARRGSIRRRRVAA